MKQKSIYSIVRDDNGKRLGMVVAFGPGLVGFSKVHPKEKFDKKLGISVAIARAIDPENLEFHVSYVNGNIPPEFQYPLERIKIASKKYFATV
jgi:hypothetical protein